MNQGLRGIAVALTIAEPVAAWLETGPRRLRVHSAFSYVINLVGDDGELVTLLAAGADDGPFALRLPCPRLPVVPASTPVRVDHGILAVGHFLIDWQPAHRWNPVLKPLEKSLEPSPVLLGCLHDSDSIFANAFQTAGHLAALRAGLQSDETALVDAVHALLGFGPGLTPAGDDCLLGVVAARRMLGQPAGIVEAAIRELASSRTTSLSAAFLRAACDGYFAGHWHRLRDALESGQAAKIEEAVCHILTWGATSGADALAGWLVGIGQFWGE